jgi:geranylgeranyl pyrophosphate synthase
LFEAASKSAALLSRVDESVVEQVGVYGYEIGMGFQIMDDILDFTGEQTAMGKPVASDLRQGLITLPALYYLEAYPQDQDMLSILNSDWCDDQCMERLLEAIRESGAIDRAHEEARCYVRRGVDALDGLPDREERHALEELALFILQRRN